MPLLLEVVAVALPPVPLMPDLSEAWLENTFLGRLRYPPEKDRLSLPVSLKRDSQRERPVLW